MVPGRTGRARQTSGWVHLQVDQGHRGAGFVLRPAAVAATLIGGDGGESQRGLAGAVRGALGVVKPEDTRRWLAVGRTGHDHVRPLQYPVNDVTARSVSPRPVNVALRRYCEKEMGAKYAPPPQRLAGGAEAQWPPS